MNNLNRHDHHTGKYQHVELVSQLTDISMADEWYEFATDDHFWIQWRFAAMLKQLKQLDIPVDQELKVFEIGCGTGTLRANLESVTKWIIDGADLNMNALLQAKSRRGRTYFYDVLDEHLPFVEAYDVVILYDILEHIPETKSFLNAVLSHLRPRGHLLINVPALQSFYSAYDELMGHHRRYNKKSLTQELSDFAFQIEDMRYWGFFMLPLLIGRKFIMTLPKGSHSDEIRRGFNPPKGFASSFNMFIRAIMRLEVMALSRPPVGTSLLLVGQKS